MIRAQGWIDSINLKILFMKVWMRTNFVENTIQLNTVE